MVQIGGALSHCLLAGMLQNTCPFPVLAKGPKPVVMTGRPVGLSISP